MTATTAPATFYGHPRGLATLFFTEFFERFSYYGMRALLVLFLTAAVAKGGLGVDDATAGSIYGIYTGAVYLFALPGGWIADRLIGTRRSIWYGGIIIASGHFLLAITSSMFSFMCGLLIIALGTGLLKPNISTLVGELYEGKPGAFRDSGFSIFYMGINLGGMIAPLVSGTVGEMFNFRWGFLTAGVAMLLGLIQFRATSHHLGEAGFAPKNTNPAERTRGLRLLGLAVLIGIALVTAAGMGLYTVSAPVVAAVFKHLLLAIAVLYFGYILLFGGLNGTEKRRVGVMIVLFLCSAMFWAGFEQAGSTFNLFARDLTDRSFLGSYFATGEHPTTWYQSFNSICIILLAPFFAWLWLALGKRNLDPSAPVKFGLGLVMLGAGFAVLLFAAKLILATGGKVGPIWLLLTYLLHTTGELCLSPVGLSSFTKLAPTRYASQLMGMWFLATAMGNLAAGQIGGQIGSDVHTMPAEFLHMTMYGVGCGLLLLLFTPVLRRWMGGIH